MENVLKQQVLDLEADKLSTHFLASNQLRLWLASFAYLLMERLRAWGCHGTALARATVGTLRLKLLKARSAGRNTRSQPMTHGLPFCHFADPRRACRLSYISTTVYGRLAISDRGTSWKK